MYLTYDDVDDDLRLISSERVSRESIDQFLAILESLSQNEQIKAVQYDVFIGTVSQGPLFEQNQNLGVQMNVTL